MVAKRYASVFAIDPGSTQSALVICNADGEVVERLLYENENILKYLRDWPVGYGEILIVEQVQSYGSGMPVGKSIFDTVFWSGRFVEAWGGEWDRMARPTIKAQLCGSAKAKDGNVRQALIDRFPASGGGKTPQIGTKKLPGPLYGMKSHLWAALAVAVSWRELQEVA